MQLRIDGRVKGICDNDSRRNTTHRREEQNEPEKTANPQLFILQDLILGLEPDKPEKIASLKDDSISTQIIPDPLRVSRLFRLDAGISGNFSPSAQSGTSGIFGTILPVRLDCVHDHADNEENPEYPQHTSNWWKQMFSRFVILLAVVVATPELLAAEEIQWQTDLDVAITVAKQQRKPLWLHCWFNGCGPCKQLETYVFPNKEFNNAVNANVIPVTVDVTMQREIAKRYNVKYVPHDVFISPTGQVLLSRKSPRDVGNYVKLLEQISKIYQKQTLMAGGGLNLVEPQAELAQFGGEVRQQSLQVASDTFAGLAGKTDNLANRTTGKVDSLADRFARNAKDKYDTTDRYVQQKDFTNYVTPTNPSSSTLSGGENSPSGAVGTQNKFFAGSNRTVAASAPTPDLGHFDNVVQNPFIKRSDTQTQGADSTAASSAPAQAKQPVVAASSQLDSTAEDLKKPALEGYCPVTLQLQPKWERGDKEWGCYHRGKLFLFASEEFRSQFMANPDRFSPALAGYDPVIYAETGKLVNGKRDIGVFYPAKDAKIFVFSTDDSKAKFQKTPEVFADKVRVATADCDARDNVR